MEYETAFTAPWNRLTFLRAVRANDKDLVALLLNRDPTVAYARDFDGSALHAAADSGHVAIVELLLNEHPHIVEQLSPVTHRTALHAAAESGQSRVIDLLLRRYPAMAVLKDHQGNTALHLAAVDGACASVALLLKAHPDLAAMTNSSGETAADYAEGDAKKLIEGTASPSDVKRAGWSNRTKRASDPSPPRRR